MMLGAPFEILRFVLLGLLGGIVYILLERAEGWEDLVCFYAFKRYALGGIVGLLYHIGHSEHGFPDSLMCFVAGYAGTTFIESLVKRYARVKAG